MSAQPQANQKKKAPSDGQILLFIIILCFSCGFLLAVVAYSLRTPQKEAKEFDQSKQMLIAAKILNHNNEFELLQEDGTLLPARFDATKSILVPLEKGAKAVQASDDEIRTVAKLRIRPILTNAKGELFTLEEKNVDLPEYLDTNKKSGYAHLPLKLVYAILPNTAEAAKLTAADVVKDISKAEMFVIPISGFGLWAPIYGYLAIANNADMVIGTTWYELAETPGLGANIAEPKWQKQFYGKLIFQEDADGKTDFKTAALGIVVIKGKVQDVYGTKPRSKNAVDGVSGATLTGNGVTAAYNDSLAPYRAFLIKVHNSQTKNGKESKS